MTKQKFRVGDIVMLKPEEYWEKDRKKHILPTGIKELKKLPKFDCYKILESLEYESIYVYNISYLDSGKTVPLTFFEDMLVLVNRDVKRIVKKNFNLAKIKIEGKTDNGKLRIHLWYSKNFQKTVKKFILSETTSYKYYNLNIKRYLAYKVITSSIGSRQFLGFAKELIDNRSMNIEVDNYEQVDEIAKEITSFVKKVNQTEANENYKIVMVEG